MTDRVLVVPADVCTWCGATMPPKPTHEQRRQRSAELAKHAEQLADPDVLFTDFEIKLAQISGIPI